MPFPSRDSVASFLRDCSRHSFPLLLSDTPPSASIASCAPHRCGTCRKAPPHAPARRIPLSPSESADSARSPSCRNRFSPSRHPKPRSPRAALATICSRARMGRSPHTLRRAVAMHPLPLHLHPACRPQCAYQEPMHDPSRGDHTPPRSLESRAPRSPIGRTSRRAVRLTSRSARPHLRACAVSATAPAHGINSAASKPTPSAPRTAFPSDHRRASRPSLRRPNPANTKTAATRVRVQPAIPDQTAPRQQSTAPIAANETNITKAPRSLCRRQYTTGPQRLSRIVRSAPAMIPSPLKSP